MASPGRARGIPRGTRAPAGSTAGPGLAQPAKRTSSCWPGWTDDGDGQCTCSWSVRDGIRQVKFSNAACLVRHRERVS